MVKVNLKNIGSSLIDDVISRQYLAYYNKTLKVTERRDVYKKEFLPKRYEETGEKCSKEPLPNKSK